MSQDSNSLGKDCCIGKYLSQDSNGLDKVDI